MASPTVQFIAERARSILASSPDSIDEAIAKAVDEAYENGPGLAQIGELKLVEEVRSALSGFGPLDDLVNNPEIEEIWINAPDQVFIFENTNKTSR